MAKALSRVLELRYSIQFYLMKLAFLRFVEYLTKHLILFIRRIKALLLGLSFKRFTLFALIGITIYYHILQLLRIKIYLPYQLKHFLA